MNRILLNASAANEGGALTIINQFVSSKKNDIENFYIIVSPHKPPELPKNHKWIKKSTNGLFTLYFALISSWFFAKYYNCSKIISFSNINTCLPLNSKVTYFHNLLILVSNSLRYKVLRFILTYLNQKKSIYIFQTPYVKSEFEKCFHYQPINKVLWPGIAIKTDEVELSMSISNLIKPSTFNLIVPITNIEYSHKNFKLINEYAKSPLCKDVKFYVTTDSLPKGTADNITACGVLTRNKFIKLISLSNGVLITSDYETLCLPIFEALLKNKAAFVLNRKYVKGLIDLFGNINGLFLFSNIQELTFQIEKSKLCSTNYQENKYSKGHWNL